MTFTIRGMSNRNVAPGEGRVAQDAGVIVWELTSITFGTDPETGDIIWDFEVGDVIRSGGKHPEWPGEGIDWCSIVADVMRSRPCAPRRPRTASRMRIPRPRPGEQRVRARCKSLARARGRGRSPARLVRRRCSPQQLLISATASCALLGYEGWRAAAGRRGARLSTVKHRASVSGSPRASRRP